MLCATGSFWWVGCSWCGEFVGVADAAFDAGGPVDEWVGGWWGEAGGGEFVVEVEESSVVERPGFVFGERVAQPGGSVAAEAPAAVRK